MVPFVLGRLVLRRGLASSGVARKLGHAETSFFFAKEPRLRALSYSFCVSAAGERRRVFSTAHGCFARRCSSAAARISASNPVLFQRQKLQRTVTRSVSAKARSIHGLAGFTLRSERGRAGVASRDAPVGALRLIEVLQAMARDAEPVDVERASIVAVGSFDASGCAAPLTLSRPYDLTASDRHANRLMRGPRWP